MNNIFVICAGEPKARRNFVRTVLNPIPEDVVLPCVPADQHTELHSWQQQASGFFAWGVRTDQRGQSMWQKLQAGDCVLGFFDFHYRTVARLVGKLRNDELASTLWSKPLGQWSWGNVIFLTKPQEIAVSALKLQPYLCSSYRGATRIGTDRINSIIRDFGSIDAFVAKSFESV